MKVSAALAAALAITACTASGGRAGPAAGVPKTVEFTLIAGQTTAAGVFNFNGYASGAMTVTVPVGWKVVIHYQNFSPLRHSFDVIPYTGKQPESAPPPVFAGASTKDLVSGIGAGHGETLSFVVDRPGKYEFFCGVLGHAQAGMWDYLIVSPKATAPAVQPRTAVTLKRP